MKVEAYAKFGKTASTGLSAWKKGCAGSANHAWIARSQMRRVGRASPGLR